MKILFLINSGRREQGPDEEVLDRFREILDESGVPYEIVFCTTPDETSAIIEDRLATGVDTLWIGAGDGTLNVILNATFGKAIVYGIVPMGTVNALARALRLPLDPVEAVRYLLKSDPVSMDVGRVEDRYFFTYATVGLHAALFHNINTDMKKRWGKLAFWESAARTVWNKSRLPRFILEMELIDPQDGPPVIRDYGYSFTVSNVANYAGWSTITNEHPASPGYFEMQHFRRNRLMPMVVWFALLRLLGIEKSRPQVGQMFRLVRWIKVRSHRKLSVQIDGEPIKTKDRRNLEFVCLDNAVRILLQKAEAETLSQVGKVDGPS